MDTYIFLVANQTVSGVSYVYLVDNSGSVIATISNVNGNGGLSYTAFACVIKGITYKLSMSGYTSCTVYSTRRLL